jgi:hypothetical protein
VYAIVGCQNSKHALKEARKAYMASATVKTSLKTACDGLARRDVNPDLFTETPQHIYSKKF